MQTYGEWSPTPLDPTSGDHDVHANWLVAPVSITRDSGILAQSNWHTLLAELKEADPHYRNHQTRRFRHWGPGWVEIILVKPGSDVAHLAQDAEDALSNYPVLDESDYSQRQTDEVHRVWENELNIKERLALCQEFGVNPMVARRSKFPDWNKPGVQEMFYDIQEKWVDAND